MKTSKMRVFLLSLALILVMTSIVAVNIFAAGEACTVSDCTGTYDNGFCNVCDGYQPAEKNASGYYEIGNAGQLYWFAALVNGGDTPANAVLTDDITVNENVLNADGTLNGDGSNFRTWTPIDSESTLYIGAFDGQSFTISGLYFAVSNAEHVGLFGCIGEASEVKNVGIVDSYLHGEEDVGGVVGKTYGTVTNCYNTGAVSGITTIGGVVGVNFGTVSNCYNTGTVSSVYQSSGGGEVGGVVGKNDGVVTNCYNTGTVSDADDFRIDLGGVVGKNLGVVTNCYNSGTVSGRTTVGGVVGENERGTVTNCHNTGTVSGNQNQEYSQYVGGVVGRAYDSTVTTDCYNTGIVSGGGEVGGVVGSIFDGGSVTNCYNMGTIISGGNLGGVVGANNFYGNDLLDTVTVTNCYSTGAVSGTNYVGGVVGYAGKITVTNCYYLDKVGDVTNPGGIEGADVAGQAEAKTADQFASGELAWQLQNGVEETSEGTPLVWGQNVDNGLPVDPYPVFANNNRVYQVADCGGYFAAYSNNPDAVKHCYENGFCIYDGTYQPAVWNAASKHYEIYNAGQLYWFAALINGDTVAVPDIVQNTSANAILMRDITVNLDVLTANGALNGDGTNFRTWNPIGNENDAYTGTFDGQSFAISGLYYNSETLYAGLFGYVGAGAAIKNVGVEDSYILATDFSGAVGGVAGCNKGTITNCYNTGTVSGSINVGGVVGQSTIGGSVTNCYNTGTVSGEYEVGGVVGYSYGAVTNCYSTGTVSGEYDVGGVIGWNDDTVVNCYNMGTVSGSFSVGGATGYNCGTVTNCYNMGTISGEGDVGGVIGWNDGTVTNCYYLYMIGDPANPSSIAETDVEGQVEGKDLEQFISGEVAYLLNGDQTSIGFGQIIGADHYPVFYNGENQVYYGSFCPAKRETYLNIPAPAPEVAAEHTFENVTCIYCGLNVYDFALELEERIAALEAALEALETQHGADIAALQQQLDDLLAELNALKNNNYATADDLNAAVERIAALEAKVAALEASVAANAEAIAKLEQAIEDLKKAMEDKDSELAAKIAELEAALAALEEAYKAADAALEEKLTALINEAKAELEAAIEELAARVTANESDIADLKAALELLQDQLSTELLAKMEELIATLETVYATKEELATAVEELWAAINSGSEDLVQKIEKLRTTLNAAIAANNATAIELTEQINKAKSALQSAINKLEADLTAAMLAGDSALDEKITALQAALDAAIAACDADDEALKQELKNAVATLNVAVSRVQQNLDDATTALEAKDSAMQTELERMNTFIIVVCVIASVGMAGCAGLVTYIIIDKRKLIK